MEDKKKKNAWFYPTGKKNKLVSLKPDIEIYTIYSKKKWYHHLKTSLSI